jgi:hypothetical protein
MQRLEIELRHQCIAHLRINARSMDSGNSMTIFHGRAELVRDICESSMFVQQERSGSLGTLKSTDGTSLRLLDPVQTGGLLDAFCVSLQERIQ